MIFDPVYWLFLIPGMLFSLWAQYRVKSSFRKYSQVQNMHNLSGFQVAQRLMQAYGLQHVGINRVAGSMTDFYDPRTKAISISETSQGPSVGAMAIVAHELGHALQDKEGYTMMRLRGSIVGIANIGSNLGIWLVFLGMILGATQGTGIGFYMAVGGLILFSAAVAFTLVTLPVEFDASRRAKRMLAEQGLVSAQDQQGVNAVLNAAAWTYVAAAATAVLQLMYWALAVFGGRRD